MKTRRLTLLAVLTSAALIMFLVENMFPPLILPGAKMGVANLVSLLTLITLGPVDALILIIVRCVLGSFIAGGFSVLMYSLPAGLMGMFVSILLFKLFFPKISVVAISVTAAVIHNLTQNIIYCFVSQTPEMLAYMPWLALAGVAAGLIIGLAARFIVRHLPMSLFGYTAKG